MTNMDMRIKARLHVHYLRYQELVKLGIPDNVANRQAYDEIIAGKHNNAIDVDYQIRHANRKGRKA